MLGTRIVFYIFLGDLDFSCESTEVLVPPAGDFSLFELKSACSDGEIPPIFSFLDFFSFLSPN